MSFMSSDAAESLADRYHIPLNQDYHALSADHVEGVLAAAEEWRYRVPPNANGSRARYFHAYLQRAVARADKES